jgi:hypothetical protein
LARPGWEALGFVVTVKWVLGLDVIDHSMEGASAGSSNPVSWEVIDPPMD